MPSAFAACSPSSLCFLPSQKQPQKGVGERKRKPWRGELAAIPCFKLRDGWDAQLWMEMRRHGSLSTLHFSLTWKTLDLTARVGQKESRSEACDNRIAESETRVDRRHLFPFYAPIGFHITIDVDVGQAKAHCDSFAVAKRLSGCYDFNETRKTDPHT